MNDVQLMQFRCNDCKVIFTHQYKGVKALLDGAKCTRCNTINKPLEEGVESFRAQTMEKIRSIFANRG